MPTDLEIARSAELRPIEEIADRCGVERSELEPYGYTKAKVKPAILGRLRGRPDGKLVVIGYSGQSNNEFPPAPHPNPRKCGVVQWFDVASGPRYSKCFALGEAA